MDRIQEYNKAIVSLLVPLITFLAGRYGLGWPADTIATVATGLGTLAVIMIPNKPRKRGRTIEPPSGVDERNVPGN